MAAAASGRPPRKRPSGGPPLPPGFDGLCRTGRRLPLACGICGDPPAGRHRGRGVCRRGLRAGTGGAHADHSGGAARGAVAGRGGRADATQAGRGAVPVRLALDPTTSRSASSTGARPSATRRCAAGSTIPCRRRRASPIPAASEPGRRGSGRADRLGAWAERPGVAVTVGPVARRPQPGVEGSRAAVDGVNDAFDFRKLKQRAR